MFTAFAKRLAHTGRLTVIGRSGHVREIRGTVPGPHVTVRLHGRGVGPRIFIDPLLAVGEAYMHGRLTVENGTIHDFFDWAGRNVGPELRGPVSTRMAERLRRLIRVALQFNPVSVARKNVAHHYDLSGRLYDLFLDPDRQYSCAYFLSRDDTLEQAQEQKKRHIASKLLLRPGQKVLDIGSGWGGLGLHLAETAGVDVTGCTLSREQHALSNRRAAESGLDGRVRFEFQDYRTLTGRYDRIVSVGMFEHVGLAHYREFFTKLHALLDDNGVALLHTIGRANGSGVTDPFIRKYIFPGGYSPALSEVLPEIERAGLYVTDIEVLRLHYAETLKRWRENFARNRDEVRELYDERFCRMWEVYLAASEAAFRHTGHVVFQIQLARRQTAAPLVRDYITDQDRASAEAGKSEDPKSRAA